MSALAPFRVPSASAGTRELAESVRDAQRGRLNAAGTVTLTANQTTTTVTDQRIGQDTYVGLTPETANAAAEVGGGTLYVSGRTAGTSFTLTHANNAQTDRDFRYVLIG